MVGLHQYSINYPNITHIKKLKLAHLFEGSNNKRMLFYHQFLTQDVILITDPIQRMDK